MKPTATIIGGSMAGLFAANALIKKAGTFLFMKKFQSHYLEEAQE